MYTSNFLSLEQLLVLPSAAHWGWEQHLGQEETVVGRAGLGLAGPSSGTGGGWQQGPAQLCEEAASVTR